jgi:hypothetical protein
MKRRTITALVAGVGVLAMAGTGLADKRTITDAEGDLNGPPHKDFVSGTQAHVGKKGLLHTATVAGKADEKEFPLLNINTKGNRTSPPEYVAQVTDAGPVVTNLATGGTKPLVVSIGEDELVNTYRFAFTKGAIGKPKRKYGWQFAYPEDDIMPNDGYAIHRLH